MKNELITNDIGKLIKYSGRPRFEGSNICTWIGFKHVMYLVEEATLEYFRMNGFAPQKMYEDHGLCLEIVDTNVEIFRALHMDDEVVVEVGRDIKDGKELIFKVHLFTKQEKLLKAARGIVKVLIRKSDDANLYNHKPIKELEPYIHNKINRSVPDSIFDFNAQAFGRGTIVTDHLISSHSESKMKNSKNSFVWKWRIPYFYCHFSDRLQHSGYLRILEEVVDLFLAARGISIRTMLKTRNWIPIVKEARVEILQEAYMEEDLFTTYTVENTYKDLLYVARMDCYVIRNNQIIQTATGKIVHGYAEINNRKDWTLVPFDNYTINALTGENKINEEK
jgi:YbgC/YbaW family acyl-CoA thioester hydrolase